MVKFVYGSDYEQACSEVKTFTEQGNLNIKDIQTLVPVKQNEKMYYGFIITY